MAASRETFSSAKPQPQLRKFRSRQELAASTSLPTQLTTSSESSRKEKLQLTPPPIGTLRTRLIPGSPLFNMWTFLKNELNYMDVSSDTAALPPGVGRHRHRHASAMSGSRQRPKAQTPMEPPPLTVTLAGLSPDKEHSSELRSAATEQKTNAVTEAIKFKDSRISAVDSAFDFERQKVHTSKPLRFTFDLVDDSHSSDSESHSDSGSESESSGFSDHLIAMAPQLSSIEERLSSSRSKSKRRLDDSGMNEVICDEPMDDVLISPIRKSVDWSSANAMSKSDSELPQSPVPMQSLLRDDDFEQLHDDNEVVTSVLSLLSKRNSMSAPPFGRKAKAILDAGSNDSSVSLPTASSDWDSAVYPQSDESSSVVSTVNASLTPKPRHHSADFNDVVSKSKTKEKTEVSKKTTERMAMDKDGIRQSQQRFCTLKQREFMSLSADTLANEDVLSKLQEEFDEMSGISKGGKLFGDRSDTLDVETVELKKAPKRKRKQKRKKQVSRSMSMAELSSAVFRSPKLKQRQTPAESKKSERSKAGPTTVDSLKHVSGYIRAADSADAAHSRIHNFLAAFFYLEPVLAFGVWICVDSFLFLMTVLPLRIVMNVATVFNNKFWTFCGYPTHYSVTHSTASSTRSSVCSTREKEPFTFGRDVVNGAMDDAKSERSMADGSMDDASTESVTNRCVPRPPPTPREAAYYVTHLTSRDWLDLVRFSALILSATVLVLCFNQSHIYHYIRAQQNFRLYVLLNILSIFAKLLSAFGEDSLISLLSTLNKWTYHRHNDRYIASMQKTKTSAFLPPAVNTNASDIDSDDASKSEFLSRVSRSEICVDLCVYVAYCVLHSVLLYVMFVTYNVAMNLPSVTLMTLLVGHNFYELKSTVFKRYQSEILFQILCSDIVERFEMLLLFLLICAQNYCYFHRDDNSATVVQWFRHALRMFSMMFGMEVVVDFIKHGFVLKFNNIPVRVYDTFAVRLSMDFAESRRVLLQPKDDSSEVLGAKKKTESMVPSMDRRLGFSSLPCAALFLRVTWQLHTYGYFATDSYKDALVVCGTAVASLYCSKLALSWCLLKRSVAMFAPTTVTVDEKECQRKTREAQKLNFAERYRMLGKRIPL